jgi:hypothetical protein
MKTTAFASLVPVLIGVALVAGATVLQGMWTDRWSGRNVAADLQQAAQVLEQKFPERFGGWEFVQELPSDPKQLERAGAVGHISRLFVNKESGAKVSAFIVCATPHDASGHTPDRCYPGAGFEIAEPEHRETIKLPDGRLAETFTGTFRKQGQTLRVFWTYGVSSPDADAPKDAPADQTKARQLRWIAPGIARIALNGETAVYKLYAIIDETRLPGGQASVVCADFLSALLPAFDEAMFGIQAAPQPEETAAGEGDKRR